MGKGSSGAWRAIRRRFSLLKYDARKRYNSIAIKSCKSRIDSTRRRKGDERARGPRVEERKREEDRWRVLDTLLQFQGRNTHK